MSSREKPRNPTENPRTAIVTPVPAVEPVVSRWREQFDATGLPAHITVLSPFLANTRVTSAVIERLSEICAESSQLEVAFSEVERFPVDFSKALYLKPRPDEGFRRLTGAIIREWPDAPPYGGRFAEVPPPHLTVARAIDSAKMSEIERAIVDELPICTAVSEARLYSYDGAQWELLATLPFSKSRMGV
jgi:2'-5' RNA ligase